MKRTHFALPLVAFAFSACGPASPKLVAPNEELKIIRMEAGKIDVETQSKVDILIVVDNSLSMNPHQVTLSNQIDKFVDRFAKNGLIDFHIGVVPVYDSIAVSKGRTIHPSGRLIPMKKTEDGTLYGTPSTPNLKEALKETIKVGTTRGPEWEESFRPVLDMMKPEINQLNQGFYREDAHLALIFITDADDAGLISPEEFYSELKKAKGGDKSKLLLSGALPLEKTCTRDDDLLKSDGRGGATPTDPVHMFRLLRKGQMFSLCSPKLGEQLAEFGDRLTEKVGRKVIFLPDDPDEPTIKVSYGSQEIPQSYAHGWSFFPNQRKIELSGKLAIKHEKDAHITVEYRAIHEANLRGGRVRVIGNY